MKFQEIEQVSFSRLGFSPHVKSPIIWGHKGSIITPLLYLTKPKSVSVEDWNEFLDHFTWSVSK